MLIQNLGLEESQGHERRWILQIRLERRSGGDVHMREWHVLDLFSGKKEVREQNTAKLIHQEPEVSTDSGVLVNHWRTSGFICLFLFILTQNKLFSVFSHWNLNVCNIWATTETCTTFIGKNYILMPNQVKVKKIVSLRFLRCWFILFSYFILNTNYCLTSARQTATTSCPYFLFDAMSPPPTTTPLLLISVSQRCDKSLAFILCVCCKTLSNTSLLSLGNASNANESFTARQQQHWQSPAALYPV